MKYTRRELGKMALAAAPMAGLLGRTVRAMGKPDSRFNGVLIGMIAPYSFRDMSMDVKSIVAGMVELGISGVELQSSAAETYAGAPVVPRGRAARAGAPTAADLRAWRLAASLEPFKDVRKVFDDAGIEIYAYKLVSTPAPVSAEEYAFCMDVARTLGANQFTVEMPADGATTKLIGDIAAGRTMMVGYHAHMQASLTAWDEAISQSKYNGINLDIGHYVAATNASPIPLILRHHGRITSLHLKDRKFGRNGGQNMPWGQGDTPIAEVLRLMKRERYGFPASIELEYRVEPGHVMTELARCREYARTALA